MSAKLAGAESLNREAESLRATLIAKNGEAQSLRAKVAPAVPSVQSNLALPDACGCDASPSNGGFETQSVARPSSSVAYGPRVPTDEKLMDALL